jgi:hypothetical protein
MRQWMVRFLLTLFTVALAGLALSVPCAAGADSQTPTGGASPSGDAKVIAYYFHGNFRCRTCRTIEAYSEEAITKEFTDELASGRLAWRVVNIDEPENKHFAKDFELVTKSLVLVEYRDGKVIRHQNLQQVWQLVGDEGAFVDYVRTSAREFLAGR